MKKKLVWDTGRVRAIRERGSNVDGPRRGEREGHLIKSREGRESATKHEGQARQVGTPSINIKTTEGNRDERWGMTRG